MDGSPYRTLSLDRLVRSWRSPRRPWHQHLRPPRRRQALGSAAMEAVEEIVKGDGAVRAGAIAKGLAMVSGVPQVLSQLQVLPLPRPRHAPMGISIAQIGQPAESVSGTP